MATSLEPNVIEGILVSRESPFARNKGFSERFDKLFQADGYDTNGTDGTSILYDVRAIYGFFLWLQNRTAEDINFEVFFSYNNFDKVTDLVGDDGNFDPDWVVALEADGVTHIAGTIAPDGDIEAELARISSRVTAVRIDVDSTTNVKINGTFSAV
jgi:hypothetical protein